MKHLIFSIFFLSFASQAQTFHSEYVQDLSYEIEVSKKSLIFNESGSAQGPKLKQKLGTVQEVLNHFMPNSNFLIADEYENTLVKVTARNLIGPMTTEMEEEFIGFVSNALNANYKVKIQNEMVLTSYLKDQSLLDKAIYEGPELKKVSITEEEIEIVGELNYAIEKIFEEGSNLKVVLHSPPRGKRYRFKVPKGDSQEILKILSSFGLQFNYEQQDIIYYQIQ